MNGLHFDVFQNYEIEAQDRDDLVRYMKDRGIETMIPWGGRAVHQFPALGLEGRFDVPRTDRLFRVVVMLPMHPELADDQVDYVVEAIRNFYQVE